MKQSVLHSLIYGGRAATVCVLFTIATLIDLALCVSGGILEISYWHLGARLILCIAASLSFIVFRYFEKLSLVVVFLVHFVISITIMLLFVWITSLYSEIHPNAYRDAVRSVLYIYPVIIIGGLAIDGIKTAKANRILKKGLRDT